MKILKIIFLVAVGAFLGYIFFYSTSESLSTTKEPSELWNTTVKGRFPDEPEEVNVVGKDNKILTVSDWFVPPDPSVVSFDPLKMWPVAQVLANVGSFKEEDWSEYPNAKNELSNQKLDSQYQDYFINEGKVPISDLTMDVDINGDGKTDKIFQSYGVGCVSCHANFIDIFVNDKKYIAFTNEGTLHPRNDKKGFYLTNAYTGDDYATCCPDNFVISKYEWNGSGFTEIARKNIRTSRVEGL